MKRVLDSGSHLINALVRRFRRFTQMEDWKKSGESAPSVDWCCRLLTAAAVYEMASTKPPLLTGFGCLCDLAADANRRNWDNRAASQPNPTCTPFTECRRHGIVVVTASSVFRAPLGAASSLFPPQKILNETPIGLWFGMMPLLTSWEIVRVCCYKDVAPNGAVLRLARGAHHLVTE